MKMTDKVLAELQKQGFLPQREDFGIVFKYQMVNYLYFENKDDDEYFNLYIPYIFDVDKENMADVFTVINDQQFDKGCQTRCERRSCMGLLRRGIAEGCHA